MNRACLQFVKGLKKKKKEKKKYAVQSRSKISLTLMMHDSVRLASVLL